MAPTGGSFFDNQNMLVLFKYQLKLQNTLLTEQTLLRKRSLYKHEKMCYTSNCRTIVVKSKPKSFRTA